MLEVNGSQARCLINKSVVIFISSLLRTLKVCLTHKKNKTFQFLCWNDKMRDKDGNAVLLFTGMIIVHRSSCSVSVPRFLIEVNMKSVMRLIHQNLLLPPQSGKEREGAKKKKKKIHGVFPMTKPLHLWRQVRVCVLLPEVKNKQTKTWRARGWKGGSEQSETMQAYSVAVYRNHWRAAKQQWLKLCFNTFMVE